MATPAAGSRAVRVPFARVEIVPEARVAAAEVLASGWVTTGPRTLTFEQDLAAYCGAAHALAVSSGTAALELSLRAMGLPAGAAVLTPSLTFCGAVQAIVHAGLRPVLVDVDDARCVPAPADVERAVHRLAADGGDRPVAMVVQHHAGHPVEVAPLAQAAGLPPDRVVQDAAHGLGGRFADGAPIGSRGRAVCLSFYATKNLPIGEGGAVLTDDADLAARIGPARMHGMSRDSWARYLPGGSWRYDVVEPGLKANFTDLQAAIGSAQLHLLPHWQSRRAELAARYDERFAAVPDLRVPPRPPGGGHAWHLYQVRLPAGQDRDELVEHLDQAGIGTSVHFVPVHQLTGFRRLLGPRECTAVPVTDRVAAQLLSLPFHPRLTDEDVDTVVGAVAEALTATRRRRRSGGGGPPGSARTQAAGDGARSGEGAAS
ncbi:MAG TPA: DegT/DnrJ/EryC1/StrS aminotransferase family protein [Kineosporiaceae bacterium]